MISKLSMKLNKFCILAIVWPFLFLFPYTIKIIEVGNDFELYYFAYHKYIFEFLKVGHLPLWSPSESGGFSLILNPLSQFFYLPSWIHYILSYIIGDLTRYSFLIYTVSALSIFNLGQFLFLKSLKFNNVIAITSTIILCCGLKLTELLRFPNALHAVAWFPWILYGINLATNRSDLSKSCFIIFFSVTMLLTAGYPYYIVYGFILFSIYFLFVLFDLVSKKEFKKISNYFLSIFLPSFFALLITFPYLSKIKYLMEFTRGRNEYSLDFSFHGSSNIYDHMGSWFLPSFAQAEGWYYFGIIVTFLIIVLLLQFIFEQNKKIENKRYIIFFIFVFLLCCLITLGEKSFLLPFLWEQFDIIKNFRFWSRFTIILIPLFGIIISISLLNFENLILKFKTKKSKNLFKYSLSAILLILIAQTYLVFFSSYENIYWNNWQGKRLDYLISNLPNILGLYVNLYKKYIYIIFSLLIFLFLIYIKFTKLNKIKISYLVLIFCISELFLLSNIQWAIPNNYYNQGFKKYDLMPNYNAKNYNPIEDLQTAFKSKRVSKEKNGSGRHQGFSYFRDNKKFNINYFNHWGMEEHTKLFDKYFYINGTIRKDIDNNTKEDALNFFGMKDNGKKIFFSKSINHESISDFMSDVNKSKNISQINMDINNYDGDNILIVVKSDEDGWISIIDNWSPGWKLKINNKNIKFDKLFNSYKSIKIYKGKSKIEMKYLPFVFF